jgi:hypothetical protein
MTREEVYKKKIEPLLKQIGRVAGQHGIGAFCTFEVSEDGEHELFYMMTVMQEKTLTLNETVTRFSRRCRP